MSENKYPTVIVPQVGWRASITGDEIKSISGGLVVGRRIDGTTEEMLDTSLGEDAVSLKPKAITKERVPNLSICLLGGPHLIDHFSFRQIGHGAARWDGEENVDVESAVNGVDYLMAGEQWFVVGWTVESVHRVSFPYKRVFAKEAMYKGFVDSINKLKSPESIYLDEYKKLPVEGGKGPIFKATGEIRLNHFPTRLNYWHYTIDAYSMENPDNPIMELKNAWQKDIAANILDQFNRTFSIISDPNGVPTIKDWEQFVKIGA